MFINYELEFVAKPLWGTDIFHGRNPEAFLEWMFGYFDINNIQNIQARMQEMQMMMLMMMLNQELQMPMTIQSIMRLRNIKTLAIYYKLANNFIDPSLDREIFPVIMIYNSEIPSAIKNGPTEVIMGSEAQATWADPTKSIFK